MSLCYGGFCQKFVEDEEFVIYEYFSYNLRENHFLFDEKIFDGFITIKKNFLIEPELKVNRKKSKKKFSKKIDVIQIIHTVYELIENGEIEIENCSDTWKTDDNGIDVICYQLCIKIFIDYQNAGSLPEKCVVHF